MQQPFVTLPVSAVAMRGVGATIRAAQTVGLEWLDLGKQGYDDVVATTQRITASRNPGERLSLQVALAQRMTERTFSVGKAMGDQIAGLTDLWLQPPVRRVP